MLVSTETPASSAARGPVASLAAHWPEYCMEAGELSLFMLSACALGALLEHPASKIHQLAESPVLRRVLMGLAMAFTAVAIIYSPWGKRSGAHFNPAITLTFFSLGKIERWDAVFYVVFQFAGGIAGVAAADSVIGVLLSHAAVNYVATMPGAAGVVAAFWGEFAISLFLALAVLTVSNLPRTAAYTPWFAGTLLALYISLEAPVSGMSMNPARTFGSAVFAGEWNALWLYFTAPPLAMWLAGQIYRWRFGAHRIFCAKLHHMNSHRCIFRCNFGAM